MSLLLFVISGAIAEEPVTAEPQEAPPVEETAPAEEAPAPTPAVPLQLQATLPPPVEPFAPLGRWLPTLGFTPIPTEPFDPDIAAMGLWRSGWGRALYPAQLDAPYPGLDETPLQMMGQGLGVRPGSSSLDLEEEP